MMSTCCVSGFWMLKKNDPGLDRGARILRQHQGNRCLRIYHHWNARCPDFGIGNAQKHLSKSWISFNKIH